MQAATDQHTIGTKVWYYDSQSVDGWVPGTVTKPQGDRLLVTLAAGNTVSLSPEACPLQNPGALRGVEVCPRQGSSTKCQK